MVNQFLRVHVPLSSYALVLTDRCYTHSAECTYVLAWKFSMVPNSLAVSMMV